MEWLLVPPIQSWPNSNGCHVQQKTSGCIVLENSIAKGPHFTDHSAESPLMLQSATALQV